MYRITSATAARALALLLLVVAVGCKKKEAVTPAGDTVTAITPAPAALRVIETDIGKGLNADKTLANKTSDFGVRDTIYVAVRTEGSSTNPAKLAAKWTFQDGQTVNETSTDIAPNTGEARYEFHIQKGTPWPKGDYHVEVLLDGVSQATKDFSIK